MTRGRTAPVALLALATLAPRVHACLSPDQWTHLEWARCLLASVGDSNMYKHRSGVVFPGDKGADHASVETDCSGLVNALLERAYSIPHRDLAAWLGAARPRAREYYNAIEAGRGFQRLDRAGDIRPGDLIATRLPEGSADTGHLMIAAGPARERTPSAPLLAGTRQWEIDVIDSTGTPHGPADTRRRADGSHATGIGRGTLRLYTDASGVLVGYAWSPAAGVKYRVKSEHGLAVGRVPFSFRWRPRHDPEREPISRP